MRINRPKQTRMYFNTKGEESKMKKKTRIIALLLVCVLIVGTSVSFVSAAELRYETYGTVSV